MQAPTSAGQANLQHSAPRVFEPLCMVSPFMRPISAASSAGRASAASSQDLQAKLPSMGLELGHGQWLNGWWSESLRKAGLEKGLSAADLSQLRSECAPVRASPCTQDWPCMMVHLRAASWGLAP